MAENVLLDVLWAITLFFLNPLLATALIASVILGYFRVKRERRSFKVRLLPGLTEFKRILSESWLHALILSILISGIGLLVDPGWLVLFCVFSLVGLLSFYYKIASPIYFAAAAFSAIYFMERCMQARFHYRGWTACNIWMCMGSLGVTIPVIAGLLLVSEGLLIRRYAARDVSPFLVHTNRGLRAAVFKAKRLWLLPVLFVVPGDMISAYIPYWPQFTLGANCIYFRSNPTDYRIFSNCALDVSGCFISQNGSCRCTYGVSCYCCWDCSDLVAGFRLDCTTDWCCKSNCTINPYIVR